MSAMTLIPRRAKCCCRPKATRCFSEIWNCDRSRKNNAALRLSLQHRILAMTPSPDTTRRKFVQTSALAAGGALVATLTSPAAVHTAGDDVLRVGLIGCGGRGTGAAAQALQADHNVKLVA